MCDTSFINSGEFLRKVHQLAKRRNVRCAFVSARGKGSHGTLYFGSAFTLVKDRRKELGAGLVRAMCKDLGIDPGEL